MIFRYQGDVMNYIADVMEFLNQTHKSLIENLESLE